MDWTIGMLCIMLKKGCHSACGMILSTLTSKFTVFNEMALVDKRGRIVRVRLHGEATVTH